MCIRDRYAGGVKGLKNTVKALKKDVKIIIVTVGLADVYDQENIDNIRRLSLIHISRTKKSI